MDTSELRRKQKEYLFPNVVTYYHDALPLESGKGVYLKDLYGREYLDFFGGILTVSVGHCHPLVTEKVIEQQKKLVHVSTLYPTVPQVELAEKLVQLRPMKEPAKATMKGTGSVVISKPDQEIPDCHRRLFHRHSANILQKKNMWRAEDRNAAVHINPPHLILIAVHRIAVHIVEVHPKMFRENIEMIEIRVARVVLHHHQHPTLPHPLCDS